MSNVASIGQNGTIIEAALSFVGAGIAGTLWWADRSRVDLPCSSQGGCELVQTSLWSHFDLGPWHDIPVALLGLAGYVLLFSFSMLRLAGESGATNLFLHRLVWLASGGGTAYSWYLQWIADEKIGAFCIWCRTSAIVMTLIFLAATWEFAADRRKRIPSPATGSGE